MLDLSKIPAWAVETVEVFSGLSQPEVAELTPQMFVNFLFDHTTSKGKNVWDFVQTVQAAVFPDWEQGFPPPRKFRITYAGHESNDNGADYHPDAYEDVEYNSVEELFDYIVQEETKNRTRWMINSACPGRRLARRREYTEGTVPVVTEREYAFLLKDPKGNYVHDVHSQEWFRGVQETHDLNPEEEKDLQDRIRKIQPSVEAEIEARLAVIRQKCTAEDAAEESERETLARLKTKYEK